MRFARLSAIILLGLPLIAFAQSKSPTDGLLDSLTSNLDIEGLETSFDPETGMASAKGEVHIKYGDTEVQCGRADYNSNTGDILAKEQVTIVKAGVIYKGENIIYNVNTGELHGNVVRSGLNHNGGNIFYTMDKMDMASKFVDRIDGQTSTITTHDLANPNYHVKAKSMTIFPGDRIVMRQVTVYAGSTPVFWFPYLSQPLDDENGYLLTPGYSDVWGAYMLNQWSMIHGDHTLAKYKLDLRSARGVAGGADFISLKQKDNQNWGRLKIYYANDSAPLTSAAKEDRTGADVSSDRYRINFQHRIYITGPADRTWHLDFDLNKISDQYFYEDFFMQEFRTDREPDNQISLIRSDPRYTATLMAKFQMNDFYRTDTRMPEIAFDFTRQPIFNTGFFYQGNTSFDILREKLGSVEKDLAIAQQIAGKAQIAAGEDPGTIGGVETGLNQGYYRRLLDRDPLYALTTDDVTLGLEKLGDFLAEDGFTRFHTYHEALYPKTVGGWLNLVPRLGLGLTSYSDIQGNAKQDLSSEVRPLVHFGLDASFKFTKTWDDVQSERLGLNGLKHTVTPYMNYSYLNADETKGLPAIDRTVPSTRPRSLDIPFYTGIDSLRSWNVARLGVRNLLQTKRDYTRDMSEESGDSQFGSANESAVQTYSWAGLNTYVDVFIDDPEFNRSVSNLFNEVFWRPVPWLTFSADTQLPIGGGDANFTEANYSVTFMPDKNHSITLGHQYIQDHPLFPNSSLVYSRIYSRINENWGFSMNHIYEIDDGTLEYQSYSLHRDLNSWVASFGFMQRDNRGVSDFGLVFSLTLKDFPQVSVPLDTDPNPTGRSIQ